jgi:hypothetical protein
LAYRLARFNPRYRTGHELLADLEPWEWDYWCLSEKLDPNGGLTELASLIASQIMNSINGVAAGFGGQELKEEQMLPLDAFVPGRKHRDYAGEQFKKSVKSLEGLRGL